MITNNPAFNLGAGVAAALAGVRPGELVKMAAEEEVLSSPEADEYNRALCKVAAVAYAADGDTDSLPARLFTSLASEENWHHGYNRFADSVRRSLSKSAAALSLVPAAADNTGDVLKSLIATGVVGGIGAGSLAFLLSRNARQTSADNAAQLERVRAYKQLRKEIDEDLAAKDLLNPDDQEKKEHYEF